MLVVHATAATAATAATDPELLHCLRRARFILLCALLCALFLCDWADYGPLVEIKA